MSCAFSRREPSSFTLFPYTTLFRSFAERHLLGGPLNFDQIAGAGHHEIGVRVGFRILRIVEIEQDRKSTRLNSSHSQISYAVFCSKTKIIPAFTTSITTTYVASAVS